jgi:hypothetical protein
LQEQILPYDSFAFVLAGVCSAQEGFPTQGATPFATPRPTPALRGFTLSTLLSHLLTLQLCPAILLDHVGHAIGLVLTYTAAALLIFFPGFYQTHRNLLLSLVRLGPLLLFAWQACTMSPDCLAGTSRHGYLVDCNHTISGGWLRGGYSKLGLSCWQFQHHALAVGVGWLSTNLPVSCASAATMHGSFDVGVLSYFEYRSATSCSECIFCDLVGMLGRPAPELGATGHL